MAGGVSSPWEGARIDGKFSWADQTNVHPLALTALLVLGVANLVVPRRFAGLPLLVLACMVTSAQCVYVLGLNFHLLRIGILILWIRLFINGAPWRLRWTTLDTLIVAWTLAGTSAYSLLFSSSSAFTYMCGQSFDALGMYFGFRCLIQSWDDLNELVSGFAVLAVPVAVAFALELATGRNAFAVFGYVPDLTPIREGRLRCQGAFAHPILAGCFWASLIPLMASHWWAGGARRRLGVLAVVAALFIVVASSSSTPLMATILCVLGAGAFAWRANMRALRWAIVLTLCVLHLVMKAPVWSLLARVDIMAGSTGWHRYALLDAAIRHFSEWAVIGVRGTAHWGWGLDDVTNQYVLEGVQGGAVTLGLFLAGIVVAFREVGRTWRAVEPERGKLMLTWALGVALFVQCMSFMAVAYFGQIRLVWFLNLAAIASVSQVALAARKCQPSHGASARLSARRRPATVSPT